MKKVFLRIAMLSLFAMLVAIPISATDAEYVRREDEGQSVIQYNLLMYHFEHNPEKSGEIYPDYYGGAYINDSGKLVIKVTDNSKAVTDQLKSITRTDEVIIEPAKYSYRELKALQEEAFDKFSVLHEENKNSLSRVEGSLYKVLTSFVGIGVDEKNNCVVVELMDTSKEYTDAFEKYVLKFDGILYEVSGHYQDNKILSPGGVAYFPDSDDWYFGGSIGYRCTMSLSGATMYGFVTAGHCVTEGEEYVYHQLNTGYDICGFVHERRFGSGTVDVAFVQTTTDYQIGTATDAQYTSEGIIQWGGVLISPLYLSTIPQGTSVCLAGQAVGESRGEVLNNSHNYLTTKGHLMSDMVKCDYDSYNGDSGGVIISYVDGDHLIVGIHKGRATISDAAIASKASNIYGEIGALPY